jgi:hypothetical protein
MEEDRSNTYVFGVNPPEPKVPRNIFTQFNFANIDEIEIARQMTLIAFQMFAQIVVSCFISKDQK